MMTNKTVDIYLGNQIVGYLTHHHDGKNLFSFAESYIELGVRRPTLSLSFNYLDNETATIKKLSKTYVSRQNLPVFFSNLLPEGGLKEYIVNQFKIHESDEFSLLEYLQEDLPGNIILQNYSRSQTHREQMQLANETTNLSGKLSPIKFSLAGIQMKFSMLKNHEHFTLSQNSEVPDWIIKTPSLIHSQLPENEYCMMRLAEAVGVKIPSIQLVKLTELELPRLNLPNEKYAYAIKRFDRNGDQRIHAEDFAQIFNVRSREKYSAANYESMAKIIFDFSEHGQEDVLEFIRRILVNILIGNTDAHLKNFMLIYPDGRLPALAPAYDLISSLGYIQNTELALNFGRIKHFYQIDHETLKYFARRIGLPEKMMLELTNEVISMANHNWGDLLEELPLPSHLLSSLKKHWQQLKSPFNIRL